MVPTDRRRPDSQFQALVEHAQVGMALIQEDRLLYVNPKYCEIFGYSRNELLAGMTQLELVAGSDRGFVASNMAKLLGGALSGAAFVFRGVRKDGATIDVEAHGAVMKIGDGLAHIVSLMDVSDRQRAAEQTREDAAQIRALLEQPVAAIFVIKDDMTIGYENRRFIELL
ncbi:MAG TPA: PAS domain S-box protein, partial [Candidatus Udaeobacter sp.]|nr:PAS domain S-box protein [Candidatus Udaeobacter sp.]